MISITKVAKAHTNSLAASLLTPLWEVQSLVAESCLGDVPICILHPSEDEIIPPAHGAAVLESAAARNRLGIWLRGASHNFVLQEEHLDKVSDFLCNQLGLESFEGHENALAETPKLGVDPD